MKRRPYQSPIPFSIFLILLFLSTSPALQAQNLIINGAFEAGNPDCNESSHLSSGVLAHWKAVSTFPTYTRKNCIPNNLRDKFPTAHTGNGHLSIQGLVWVTGYMDCSVVKGKLVEPLEAGTNYYLEFYGRYDGLRNDESFTSKNCLFSPPPDLSIFLGKTEDTISVEKIFDDSTLYLLSTTLHSNFQPVSFSRPFQVTPVSTGWTKYSTCLQASGGESQIALAGPIRSYSSSSPCNIIEKADFDRYNWTTPSPDFCF